MDDGPNDGRPSLLLCWRSMSGARVFEVDDIDGIVQILIAASTSEATDPRDRIYAILGLLPPKLDIRPRYDLSVEESLAEAMMMRTVVGENKWMELV